MPWNLRRGVERNRARRLTTHAHALMWLCDISNDDSDTNHDNENSNIDNGTCNNDNNDNDDVTSNHNTIIKSLN